MTTFYQSLVTPLAQTFFVKRTMAQGASCLFLANMDLFFNAKSSTRGITVEIRTVVNGYPTSEILPFATKRLTASDIVTSTNGAAGTTFTFDNPIKLLVETEYAIVVIPDANDPDYILFTSVTGSEDLSTQTAITQDWGDGVLFTSTNNSAWKSQQTEDLKFTLRRYEFNSTTGYVNLIPKDVEFFTISDTVNEFIGDEIVYSESGVSESATLAGREVSFANNTPGFVNGDYIVLDRGGEVFVSKITSLVEGSPTDTVKMEGDAYTLTGATANSALTATLAVGAKASFYDKETATRLYAKESSARAGLIFAANTTVKGFISGATATIDSVDNKAISYIQPIVFTNDGDKTETNIQSFDSTAFDQNLTLQDNNYLLGTQRYINSKSNDNGDNSDFVIRVNMDNNGFTRATPIVDTELSMIHGYRYKIEDDITSSSYVSKEVVLQEDMGAVGLKVLLSAFRPIGTMVDVYARFKYLTDVETKSDWILLDNNSSTLFSNSSDVYDYRDFSYDLDEDTYSTEFISFQTKIVMRHATSQELGNASVIPNVNTFPHINDYRAIALT